MPNIIKNPIKRNTALCGFSLVEVVLVVIIISIVAVMAVPRFAKSMARHRVDLAAKRVIVDLKLARQLAKTTSKKHRVRFVYGTSKYVVESLDGATWKAIADMDRKGADYEVDLGAEPYLVKVTNIRKQSLLDDPMVVYNGFGLVTTTTWLVIQNGESFNKIEVDGNTGEPLLTVVDTGTPALDPGELSSETPLETQTTPTLTPQNGSLPEASGNATPIQSGNGSLMSGNGQANGLN